MVWRIVGAMLLLGSRLLLGTASADVQENPTLVDVFVSGTEGYHTFRIPALVVTPAGDLLAICEGRKASRADDGDIDLVLRRSRDQGRTWGPLELLYEEGGDQPITIGNPCPVVDETTGVIWLTFCRNNERVFVTSSRDDGRTWNTPREITEQVKRPEWDWYATGPGNAIQLTRAPYAGRLVVPCDHRVRGQEDWRRGGRSHVIYSDDHGATWHLGEATDAAMNECAVVELEDGRLLLNMRSYRGRGCRAVATSGDGGEHWSEARDVPELIEPVCQASLIRYNWPGESAPGVLLFSNPASQDKRHRLTLRSSHDDGQTWTTRQLIYADSAAYSSLARLPDGEVGILFERDDYKQISLARLAVMQPRQREP